MTLSSSYDKSADVLYIAKWLSLPCITEEDPDGLLARYLIANGKPSGVTVMSFRELWMEHTDELISRISDILNVSKEEARSALPSTPDTTRDPHDPS